MSFAPSASFSAYKPPPALRRSNPWAAPADPAEPSAVPVELGAGGGAGEPAPSLGADFPAARTAEQPNAEPHTASPDAGPAAYAARALTSMIDPSHSIREQAIAIIMRENHCNAREARHTLQAAAVRNQLEVADVAAAVLALAAGDPTGSRAD